MKLLLFILLLLPALCFGQGTTIKGSQLRDGTVTFAKLDTTGFPFVKTNKSTMQSGYFNINSGYMNSLYFPSSGLVNATTQLYLNGGDNALINGGAGGITLQTTGDIIADPAGGVYLKNIITTDPGSGQATVLLGKIVTGIDGVTPYWEILVDGALRYIPVYTMAESLQQINILASGTGSTAIDVTLPYTPAWAMVGAKNLPAANIAYWEIITNGVRVYYTVAPASGSNNLSYWINYK